MGFGHRVYKSYDPRAKIIKRIADLVFDGHRQEPAARHRARARAHRAPGRLLRHRASSTRTSTSTPGLIYQAMGFPVDMFPVLFAIPRTAGWLAQWEEMLRDPDQKIARPRQIYIGRRAARLRAAGPADVDVIGRRPTEALWSRASAPGRRSSPLAAGVGRPLRLGAAGAPQAPAVDRGVAVRRGRAWEHLRQMVAIGPRPAGSAAIEQTRAYITRQLSARRPDRRGAAVHRRDADRPVDMVNLIVTLPGRRTGSRSAHRRPLRHEALAEFAFVGASDGASSAAFLIELARVLEGPAPRIRPTSSSGSTARRPSAGLGRCGTPDSPTTYGSRHYVQAAQQGQRARLDQGA